MSTTVLEWGTVSMASMIGMVFSFLVSVGLPIALMIIAYKKYKANILHFFIGCAIFVVFALVLESIMHQVVFSATGTLITGNVFLYALYGGLAAALFEETGRFVAMKFFMKKDLNKQNALMYGIGHGGIEAIMLVGMTYISNLLSAVMINSGLLANSMALLDEETQITSFNQIKVLWETPAWHFYMAGVERVAAIVLQIALSVLVYRAVKEKCGRFWLIAFLIHFAVDFITVVLVNGLNLPIWLFELLLLAAVGLIAWYARKQYLVADTEK